MEVLLLSENLPNRVRSSSQFPRMPCAENDSPDSLRHVTPLHQLHRTTYTVYHSTRHGKSKRVICAQFVYNRVYKYGLTNVVSILPRNESSRILREHR